MERMEWRSVCCNPFGKKKHTVARKSLRPVSQWMCEQVDTISMGMRICDSCRKKLKKSAPATAMELVLSDFSLSEPSSPPSKETLQVEEMEALHFVNQCLEESGQTPLTKRQLQYPKITEQKIEKVTSMFQKVTVRGNRSRCDPDESEMLQQLKEKFDRTKENSLKLQILTVLPKSWSVRKIQVEFGVSDYMARRAKLLVKEKGILSTPDPKPGHVLSKKTTDSVIEFYENDESSRMMPGKKDYVSVRDSDGFRRHVQKRLVLCNLKELYQHFKETYPATKIGFSKFAELRPPHCILAGASGTHSVCVCTIHQNIKLMIAGARMPEFVMMPDATPLTSYHDFLAKMICNPALPKCYLRECGCCPGVEHLKEHLLDIFDKNMIDNVIYKQWTNVDRSTLETLMKSSDEFVEVFCEKMLALQSHSFIATQQSRFFSEYKSSLKPGEVVVSADFSENYAFIIQDSAQGFHWNNAQATIHPFVAYCKEGNTEKHLSFVVISECLHHDTVAVHLFQRHLIDFLMIALAQPPEKIIYFSDGAASQYKNRKNFINLCYHYDDFRVAAEWHFSATSHGKGACDGLGGTIKRLAARASLQRLQDDQITTPLELYEWAKKHIPQMTFCFCSTEEYKTEKTILQERFENSQTITGTRKLHSFIPTSTDTLQTRVFSSSAEYNLQKVTKKRTK